MCHKNKINFTSGVNVMIHPPIPEDSSWRLYARVIVEESALPPRGTSIEIPKGNSFVAPLFPVLIASLNTNIRSYGHFDKGLLREFS